MGWDHVPASYIVAERWASQPYPGDCRPESWRGLQGKAPMAKDLAFKDQGQLGEPDTWAPGSSQVLGEARTALSCHGGGPGTSSSVPDGFH